MSKSMSTSSEECDDDISEITFHCYQTMESVPTLYQPSPPDSDEEATENYVASTGEDFNDRMKHWMPIVEDIYPVQLAAIFKAGETINLNFLEKEPRRLLEIALKYKLVVRANQMAFQELQKLRAAA